jgi:hypothetical protein
MRPMPASHGHCAKRNNFRMRLAEPRHANILKVDVFLGGGHWVGYAGDISYPVYWRGLPRGRFRVKVRVTFTDGSKISGYRQYVSCRR